MASNEAVGHPALEISQVGQRSGSANIFEVFSKLTGAGPLAAFGS